MSRKRWSPALMGENVAQAAEIVRSQRTRSILLMLGVAIGTATLLAMISLLFGLKGKLRQDIVASNVPYLNILKYDPLQTRDIEAAESRPDFTPELYERFAQRVETMDTVVYTRELAPQAVPPMLFRGKERAEFIWVWGSSLGAQTIFNLELAEGRFFTEEDVTGLERIAERVGRTFDR